MNRRVRRKVAAKGKGIVVSPSYPEAIEDDEEDELVGGISHPSSLSVVVIGGDRTEVDWTALPDDTVIQLFSCLNYRDRARLSSTCRTWRALGSSDCLWESLDLRSHRCDPAMADALSSRCSHLESLRFRGAESADALINFRARNLKEISGDYCRKITDSALSVIAARHEFLECLELGPDFCERISSDAIKAVGICCPRLKRLRLSGLREIDFDAVETLAANCRNLMDVGFMDCLKVDETALGNVASLRFLSVAGTTNLKWATASQVWITLPNLVGLDVSRTDIGASAITRLLSSSSKSLRVLCALNCPVLELEGSSAVRVAQGKALLTIFADVFRGVCSLLEHNTTNEKEVFLNWRSSKNKKGLDQMMTWLEWILSHSLLRIAESNPQGLDEFWITQGAALLLSLMQSSQDDVQEKAASGLATFVVIDDENATIDCKRAEAVMKGGGVRLLLGLATSWREGLQSEAAKALANLSVNTCVAKAVAEDGGITILANLAKSMNRLVAEEAAGGLWNLSVGEEHKGAIAAAGGIKALVDLVFKWSKGGDGVLERAAGALANLAADDRCSMEIAVTGGVHALVMLARNCKFEGVQEQAARALANLAAHGDSNNTNATVGQESGALEALVELTSSPHEGVRQEAAGALWNLSFDDRNREAIAEARGVEALVLLAQSCSNASPGLQERAAGALWGLSVSETNSIAIGREGGIPPLIALAQSEAEDVHETAAGALWNLAFNPGNALRIVEESGVPALIHLSTVSKSKMARFMATLALSYMFDGRMDELAHVGTSAEGGAVKCINLESSRRMALKHIGSFILTFSNRQAFAVAASSSAPAALAQVTETARIHEAGHLRCSGAEIGRFITMLRNPTSTLKACAAFALLQFTLPGGRHARHHVTLLQSAGAARALRSAAAAATAPLEHKIFARIVLRNLEHFQKGATNRALKT